MSGVQKMCDDFWSSLSLDQQLYRLKEQIGPYRLFDCTNYPNYSTGSRFRPKTKSNDEEIGSIPWTDADSFRCGHMWSFIFPVVLDQLQSNNLVASTVEQNRVSCYFPTVKTHLSFWPRPQGKFIIIFLSQL